MHRGRLPAACCRHVRVDGLKRRSGRNASPSGINTPSTIMSPAGSQPQVVDRDKPGARAHTATIDSAVPALVKRYALGPAGRPTGDNPPHLALKRNEVEV
jgi:hypothetical protein